MKNRNVQIKLLKKLIDLFSYSYSPTNSYLSPGKSYCLQNKNTVQCYAKLDCKTATNKKVYRNNRWKITRMKCNIFLHQNNHKTTIIIFISSLVCWFCLCFFLALSLNVGNNTSAEQCRRIGTFEQIHPSKLCHWTYLLCADIRFGTCDDISVKSYDTQYISSDDSSRVVFVNAIFMLVWQCTLFPFSVNLPPCID